MSHRPLRHHLPTAPQGWAVTNMRDSHNDSLYRFGEYAIFVMLWDIRDHNAGLVDRCPECYGGSPYSEVYKQSNEHNCEACLGTTFEGGYKAKIVRPSLWDFGEEAEQEQRRGIALPQSAGIQSTSDFRMKTGDFIIRADNTRWVIESTSANHLRTGFGFPQKSETVLGFNWGQCRKEDTSSVVYTIDPRLTDEVRALLDPVDPRFPVDFGAFEEIRAPLVHTLDGAPDLQTFPSPYLFPATAIYPGEGTYP